MGEGRTGSHHAVGCTCPKSHFVDTWLRTASKIADRICRDCAYGYPGEGLLNHAVCSGS